MNTTLKSFVGDVKILKNKLFHQNFKLALLNRYVKKFIFAKPPCTYKFWAVLNLKILIFSFTFFL